MRVRLIVSCLCAAAASSLFAAEPLPQVDWSKVPSRTVTLFYPGQSSYEWLRASHTGEAKAMKAAQRGEACTKCHEGDERAMGAKIVKGGPLEPVPVKGKVGAIDLVVQAAYDARNAYLRFQWKTQNPYPGSEHQYLRFDGKEWKVYGYPKLDKVVQEGKQPGIYEDRLAVMIDDGKVPGFAAQGCWLTCHDGSRDMPKEFTSEQVKANALLTAIKKSDVRKYLPFTRTDENASWDKGVPLEQIDKLKAEGKFLDLIQWRAHRSNPVGMADDGYVLDWRNFDAGANPFASNMDAKTKQPRYMFDAAKAGNKAFSDNNLPKSGGVLLLGQNAVPFDPNAGWKAGDVLPQYTVSADNAKGSGADNKYAKGVWKDGTWTLVWARPLHLKNPDDKALREGKSYTFSFAVHDDNITTRGHQISFPLTVGFGTKADIEATKLK